MANDVIIALDFENQQKTLAFLDRFPAGEKPYVKIGMELFYAEGPEIVRQIKARRHRIFLDLKLHDIPNTVKKAMAVLSRLDVDMVNLHAAGTRAMMEAALEGLTRPDGSRPLLLAVTQLTSTSGERMRDELLIDRPLDQVVMAYAQNAAEAGLDGVVCSPLEAGKVHQVCGEGFLTVTPGIRFAGSDAGDQVRITTPQRARELGSDYIVVGRPITQAEDPAEAYRRAVREFTGKTAL
ncbi:MAG: orotidine-5'-phosphate decarboxylase [Clostridia bacterium]|nr:orotidine-5'-phosphate decarboxylase [Clostridia bacterium]MDY2929739.1 orotidine-5'-phosphate decarboxylase [Clostridiaceae bacterium]